MLRYITLFCVLVVSTSLVQANTCESQVQISYWKRMSGDKPDVDIGYLKCHKHYVRSEVGVSLFSEGEHNYYGAKFGLRLQPNWDIAPFIGIGATAGFRE